MMPQTHSRKLAVSLAALLAATSLSACATKGFVRTEVGAVDTKLTATQGDVATAQGQIAEHDTRIGAVDATAKDALERANAAGKLAEGKFNYTVLLQDDAVKFARNQTKLTPEAEARLMAIADKLKSDNKNVYVEVQGHTDPTEAERLGDQRASTVLRFLNQHGVPLNRIASISFGKSEPVAPNTTPAGRAQNRRAVILVLS